MENNKALNAAKKYFSKDLEHMRHILSSGDFDKYLLGFCRGIEYMSDTQKDQLDTLIESIEKFSV